MCRPGHLAVAAAAPLIVGVRAPKWILYETVARVNFPNSTIVVDL